jgi:hypothetical protein
MTIGRYRWPLIASVIFALPALYWLSLGPVHYAVHRWCRDPLTANTPRWFYYYQYPALSTT